MTTNPSELEITMETNTGMQVPYRFHGRLQVVYQGLLDG